MVVTKESVAFIFIAITTTTIVVVVVIVTVLKTTALGRRWMNVNTCHWGNNEGSACFYMGFWLVVV